MAASLDELVDKLWDMTECPVCLEQFKEPRMLPCQHSFCTECLQGILGTGQTITCPFCKKYTPVPSGVRELPVDFRANSLLETLSGHEKPMAPREAEAVPMQAAEEAVLGAEAAAPQATFGRMSLGERCPVCEEIPTVSKNLSCGHRLCENCVQFLLPVGGDTLHCPTCSRQTRIVRESNTRPETSPQRSQPGATPEGVDLSHMLPMLEPITRAASVKGPPQQTVDFLTRSSHSEQLNPPSPPNTPRPSFLPAPALAPQAAPSLNPDRSPSQNPLRPPNTPRSSFLPAPAPAPAPAPNPDRSPSQNPPSPPNTPRSSFLTEPAPAPAPAPNPDRSPSQNLPSPPNTPRPSFLPAPAPQTAAQAPAPALNPDRSPSQNPPSPPNTPRSSFLPAPAPQTAAQVLNPTSQIVSKMAASLDELVTKLWDMTECPVCLEQFKEPRMLPCQHSFCTECLEGLRGTEHTIRCPFCKKSTPLPSGVRELPVDFSANSLMEMLSGHEKLMTPREAEAAATQAAEEAVLGAEAAVLQATFGRLSLDEPCPVCEEIPTVSKNLSCGHHLCGSCVQFLLSALGDTLHCPTCSRQTRIIIESNTRPGTSPQRSRPGATPEGVDLSHMLPMLEPITRATTVKGTPQQTVDFLTRSSHSEQQNPPSPPNTPRPSFLPAPAPAPAPVPAPAPAPNPDRSPSQNPPSPPNTPQPSFLPAPARRAAAQVLNPTSQIVSKMAASLDELVTKLWDMTECPVCLEQFKEPRMLRCQHSFCTECLEGLRGTEQTITCPFCKKYTPLPSGVRELPVDFRANSLLETLSGHEKPMARREAEAAATRAAEEAVLRAEAAVLQAAFACMSQRCPVCKEIPTVSKNLSCGHPLCESCVQLLLSVGGDTLHCPTCFCQTRIIIESNTRPGTSSQRSQPEKTPEHSQLTFHPRCGKNAVVSRNRLTAHRKNPRNEFIDALVLTSRHLKANELFEVQLDKKVHEWTGSIEIGLTTHPRSKSALPEDIKDLGSGTWYMTSCTVLLRSTIIKTYKKDLDDLKVGDCVGVQRRENGDLHFYIYGVDLGVAAHNVPAGVYGVVNVCGNAQQVTIADTSGIHPRFAKPTQGCGRMRHTAPGPPRGRGIHPRHAKPTQGCGRMRHTAPGPPRGRGTHPRDAERAEALHSDPMVGRGRGRGLLGPSPSMPARGRGRMRHTAPGPPRGRGIQPRDAHRAEAMHNDPMMGRGLLSPSPSMPARGRGRMRHTAPEPARGQGMLGTPGKRSVCEYFLKGKCKFDKNCRYLHPSINAPQL